MLFQNGFVGRLSAWRTTWSCPAFVILAGCKILVLLQYHFEYVPGFSQVKGTMQSEEHQCFQSLSKI